MLGRLRQLDQVRHGEIRGQSQVLPRVVSVVRRAQLNLTKPAWPRGSFLLLGPTGVGKTETVIVLINHFLGPDILFRFDMEELRDCLVVR